VRDGDAVAEPGGAKQFAIVDGFEDGAGVLPGGLGGLFRKSFKHFALGRQSRANNNGLLGEDVGKFH
jgi:hypothetical protein